MKYCISKSPDQYEFQTMYVFRDPIYVKVYS